MHLLKLNIETMEPSNKIVDSLDLPYMKPKESLLLNLHVDCLGKCHIESFNFMLGDGLKLAVADLDPVEFLVPETNDRISLWITDATLSKPTVAAGSVGATNSQVLLNFNSCFNIDDYIKL